VGDVLVSSKYFVTERLSIDGSARREARPGQVAIVIEGSGQVCGQPAKAGEAWLVPPQFDVQGKLILLTASPPKEPGA
jgi:hypothetical protein